MADPIRTNITTDSGFKFTIVDADGDGRLNGYTCDHFELEDGSWASPRCDKRIKSYFDKIGIYYPHDIELSKVVRHHNIWQAGKAYLNAALTPEDVRLALVWLKSFKIFKLNHRSAMFKSVMEASGKFGCYLPRDIADRVAEPSSLFLMNETLVMAEDCAERHELDDPEFHEDLAEIRERGTRPAVEKILAIAEKKAPILWVGEDTLPIDKALEAAMVIGKDAGIWGDYSDRAATIKRTADHRFDVVSQIWEKLSAIKYGPFMPSFEEFQAQLREIEAAEDIAISNEVFDEWKGSFEDARTILASRTIESLCSSAERLGTREDFVGMEALLEKAEIVERRMNFSDGYDRVSGTRYRCYIDAVKGRFDQANMKLYFGKLEEARALYDDGMELYRASNMNDGMLMFSVRELERQLGIRE